MLLHIKSESHLGVNATHKHLDKGVCEIGLANILLLLVQTEAIKAIVQNAWQLAVLVEHYSIYYLRS